MKVVGYPASIATGMNDPADVVGFTNDGSEYGYCATIGARDPAMTMCETIQRDGTKKVRSTDDESGQYSKARATSLDAWIKASGMATIPPNGSPTKRLARPVTGNWAFTDITVRLAVAGDGVKTSAVLQVGGAVNGEPPVYPVTLSAKAGTAPFHTVWTNDLALSPDGTEIGIVGGFFCMEWCDDFVVYRNRVGAFASLVYNDTGFRHHKKGDYARAAELFLAATSADESAKLPPYNLACAWARLGDPRAKDALALAIEHDPSVRSRARNDEDFAQVKTEAWFNALTAAP
jgi:hypothetical protein